MSPLVAAGLISAGSQLLGNGLQYRQTKSLYDYQHSKNVQDWYRENQYNSPVEQMNRLKAAGLNPNLVYQSGNPIGASGSIESASPQVVPNDFGSAGSQLSQAMIDSYYRQQQLEHEESNIMSLIEYREFINQMNSQKTEGQSLDNEKKRVGRQYWSESAYFEFLAQKQAYKNAQEQYNKLKAETALTWSQNSYTKQGKQNLQKQLELNDRQIANLEAGMRKMATEQWQILFQAGISKLRYDLDRETKDKVIEKYTAEIDKLQKESRYIDTQTDLKGFIASGRKELRDDLEGNNGKISEITAGIIFDLYDIMANMPFSFHSF